MKKILIVMSLLLSLSAMAQNIHFFGSVTGAKNTVEDEDRPFDSISKEVTVAPLTTAGMSLDATLNDRYQVLIQFIFKNERDIGVDLLQFRYNIDESSSVRLGRQRLPFSLHSENIQVQALLPWMTAPREVYAKIPIYSFTGASYERMLGSKIRFHFYTGDTKDYFINDYMEYKTENSALVGARLTFEHEQHQVFINSFQGEGSLDVDKEIVTNNPLPGASLKISQSYDLGTISGITGGFQFKPNDFFLMSEYFLVTTESAAINRMEAFYVSLGTELAEKWVPVLTFSSDLDVEADISPSKTTSYQFNLNYRLDLNNVLKLGIEHVNYKEVTSGSGLTAYNGNIFAPGGSPGENFEIYSVMWAFVY